MDIIIGLAGLIAGGGAGFIAGALMASAKVQSLAEHYIDALERENQAWAAREARRMEAHNAKRHAEALAKLGGAVG
jgi:hypothetical protein